MPLLTNKTDDWVSINTESLISVGTQLKAQNQSNKFFVIALSDTKPSIDSFAGEVITPLSNSEPSKVILTGSKEAWIRCTQEGEHSLNLYVQDWNL